MSREIAVIMALSLFIATGFFLTVFACINGRTPWPFLTLFISAFSLLVFFGCGLASSAMDEMPAFLSDNDASGEECLALGWFVFGSLLTATVALPLLLAWARIVPMNISWISCVGSWSFTATVALVCILMMKG
jgi:hypothetical protein